MNTKISSILKTLRSMNGIKQEDVAKAIGISKSGYGYYEQGRSMPDPEMLLKLSKFFNVSVDYLLGNTDEIHSKIELNIPQEYANKYKITPKDKKQYIEHMKKANEAFFMNDEFDEEDKKEILDTMNEIFWKAKSMNKRKPKDE
ncbi:helix-turn-helix domain-containing protein [Clostridium felsineum]|uniref:Uncharacterized protein n=1 Tax=Clostridium felsineum TaxID=36839 RepID=A0A1S8L3A8_9CLOT|nr:helix-turn-helix domain-containing protein [Clostridium felsineum]URZ07562.1 hypothetical protein CLROS_029010 [Clostridium felsineum]URZ12593.1 hypothetical protein CROST_033160 [Clostridium felsineum]